MTFLRLKDLDFRKKRVLVRVDFNVPLKGGDILDDSRIKACLPTINYLIKKNARIILISHLGDPQGRKNTDLSLINVAKRLSILLKRKVGFVDDCVGVKVKEKINSLDFGEVILLENLRFHKGEEGNDQEFAKQLSSLADVFVNDAFSVAHRSHASIAKITRFLPSCAGFLMDKEIMALSSLNKPKRPFVFVIGGKKISTKIKLIKNLLKKTDCILVGGAMMFTFYKSNNINVGKSFVEDSQLNLAKFLLKNSKNKIVLPIDVSTNHGIKNYKSMSNNDVGLDIGPETIKIYSEIISKAETVVWNGPLGMFEIPKFAKGSKEIARSISDNKNCFSIVGGGETLELVKILKLRFSHISTGGGAMLSFLEGTELPGLKALAHR